MKKQYTCIICPRGCLLTLDDSKGVLSVKGNSCGRGEQYALQEYRDPQRTLTSTVKLVGGTLNRLPVVTSCAVPREKIARIQEEVLKIAVTAPVTLGDVIVSGIADTKADLIASRSISSAEHV